MTGCGRFTIEWRDPETGGPRRHGPFSNDLTWGFPHAIVRALFGGEPGLVLNTIYVEYENVAAPGDPAAPPAEDAGDSLAYYQSLADVAGRDYLRLAVSARETDADPADTTITDGLVNRGTLVATVAGAQGLNGRPFGSGSNSVICGLAAVISPSRADPSRDLVVARLVYQEADQLPVPADIQLAVRYRRTLTPA